MEVKFDGVSFVKEGSVLLQDFTYSFSLGISAIIGPSNSGKSLVLDLFRGEVWPTSGRVLKKEMKIGYIPQQCEELFIAATVYDELSLGLVKKLDSKEINKKIREVLKLVGLSEGCLMLNPRFLSRGEKFRLALSAIIIGNFDVLLLDEPSLYLDELGKNVLVDLIKKIGKLGKIVVIASNDIDFVYRVTDSFILLNQGKMVLVGGKEEIFEKSNVLLENDMEIPKIVEFVKLANDKSGRNFSGVKDVEELVEAIVSDE